MTHLAIENTTSIEDLVQIAIQTNKGDWWGDSTIGSTLWLLQEKGKVNSETLAHASDAILASLQTLKDDGLITDAKVQTSQSPNKDGIVYTLEITTTIGQTKKITGHL